MKLIDILSKEFRNEVNKNYKTWVEKIMNWEYHSHKINDKYPINTWKVSDITVTKSTQSS